MEGNPFRYPADQVYRVMSMDNWPDEVRSSLNKYLNLTATKYLSLVRKGMSWLRKWEINNEPMELNYGWNDNFDVKHSDSREIVKLPNGYNFLNSKWRWFDNIRSFEDFHERPPPQLMHYVVPPGQENHHDQLLIQI